MVIEQQSQQDGQWEGKVLRANTNAPLPSAVKEEDELREWSGLGLWFRWVVATTAGWLVAGAVAGMVIGLTGEFESALYYGASYVCSVFTFALQWLVLRPRLTRAWRWVPVSMAGSAVGLALVLALQAILRGSQGYGSATEALVAPFADGLPLALAQWLLLMTVARKAWRWILANLTWLVLYALYAVFNRAPAPPEIVPGIEVALSAAMVVGMQLTLWGLLASAITGTEMVWLMRHPKGQPSRAESAD